MVKLLIIADDFTGALDTGVQFRAKGTVIRFGSDKKSFLRDLDEDVNILIVDTETRHLPPEQAGEIVYRVVQEAVQEGVSCIYKKTDSGLRGNVGAELSAVLDASGSSRLHFIPAYPKMNRITKNGIHYIDGIPVAQSVFGVDPFEPVRFSAVEDILHSQSTVPVTLVQNGQYPNKGIALYDAETEQDLHSIAQKLQRQDELHLLAGCAGFAAVLPDLLKLEPTAEAFPDFVPRLVTICGSINPITLKQLDAAEEEGVPRVRLSIQQKLDADWLESWEAQAAINAWTVLAHTHSSTIIECDGLSQPEQMEQYRKMLGLDLEQMRCRIANTMGSILKKMLDHGLEATLLVTGGDTLMAFMKMIHQDELVPISEFASGVVLSRIHYRGKSYNLLSKSGGFGSMDLMKKLEKKLISSYREELVC